MRKFLLASLLCCFTLGFLSAQSMEDLMVTKATMEADAAPYKAKLDSIQAEIAKTQAAINALPGWEHKFFGTLGGNVAQFNDWFSAAGPNSRTSSIIATLNGLADYDSDKILWKNNAQLNIGGQKIVEDTGADADSSEWQKIPDQFLFSSLVGYKILPKLALSGELSYRTPVLSNFNNPGDLDLGVGATWTPIPDFFLMVHPLNYHWKFGDNADFNDALGARVKAGYAKNLVGGISWVSQLEGFYSYQEFDPSAHWWEWNNGFAFSVWKGIGVGVNFALRAADSEITDQIQSRWNIGLAYTL